MVELTELAQNHKDYVEKQMTSEDRMLVTLRDELHFGSWNNMETDLRDRLKVRPYIFKIVNRIEEDLNRIDGIKAYELKHDINLTDYVEDFEERNKVERSPY